MFSMIAATSRLPGVSASAAASASAGGLGLARDL
jgi:hypothetical protein